MENPQYKIRILTHVWKVLGLVADAEGEKRGRPNNEVFRAVLEEMLRSLESRSITCDDTATLIERDFGRFGKTIFQNIQESIRFLDHHVSKALAGSARQALLTALVSPEIPTSSLKRMLNGVEENSFNEAKIRRISAMESMDPREW